MIDISSLPANLRPYVATQHYEKYTARDHAAWRYIMRQSREFFKKHAHSVYLDGLEKTGVPIDRIPRVSEMDQKLSEFGWGAICVKGFIPPAAFLEFQSRSLLPIAADMRTVEHIAYTPAPDIVHEAAGHAPIIADPLYAEYLKKYAKLAKKAIYSSQDVDLYEAIRVLSDVKENPDSTTTEIAQAELALTQAVANFTYTSESAQITRMYWWTAEYGLVKKNNEYKIYGAGLLSSVGESQECLTEKVKKIPISLACVEQAFNITEPQPQLFYAEDFQQLIDLLGEFEKQMSFVKGGIQSLEKAIQAHATTTTVLDSGLQISAICGNFEVVEDQISFIKWTSPTQISIADQQLSGHGTSFHAHGFSTPIGLWVAAGHKNPSTLTHAELKKLGLVEGQRAQLDFQSGFTVNGMIKKILFHENSLVMISWDDCTVKKGEIVYFAPEWGCFDMAVGTAVVSVFGGAADFAKYDAHQLGQVTTSPLRSSPFTENEIELFNCYQIIRDLRDENLFDYTHLKDLFVKFQEKFSKEWLIFLELLEIVDKQNHQEHFKLLSNDIRLYLQNMAQNSDLEKLIVKGIAITEIVD